MNSEVWDILCPAGKLNKLTKIPALTQPWCQSPMRPQPDKVCTFSAGAWPDPKPTQISSLWHAVYLMHGKNPTQTYYKPYWSVCFVCQNTETAGEYEKRCFSISVPFSPPPTQSLSNSVYVCVYSLNKFQTCKATKKIRPPLIPSLVGELWVEYLGEAFFQTFSRITFSTI